jgi:glycosyltransferase involved in cell wall biosynthesis
LFPIVLVQLVWFLLRERIQIVNLHFPIDNFFYFAICRRLLPIRLVTSVHGSDAFDRRGRPKEKYSHAFRFLVQSSDLIILPSDTYRERLLQAFPGARAKTIFIHNGVNPAQFSSTENGRNRDGRNRYILCIALLNEWKGIDVLLKASKSLLAADDALRLVLIGDGPLRRELEALASSLGIRNQTDFLGGKGAADVASLLRGCEVFALPSRAESFGVVITEAMACKKPVVATKVGGIPEIIENGKTGILVEPDDPEAMAEALRSVLADNDLKRTLGENGYSRVLERFCFDHTGAAYEAALSSSLGLESHSL